MPAEVAKLAETLLRDPVRVDVAVTAPAKLPIEQHVHFVDTAGKRALLGRLLDDPAMSRVIVFTRTKRSADRVAETLDTGGVRVSAIHGNKSQPARIKALEQFRSGRARVLVATDIAARGIDVTGISHVINFDLPAAARGLRPPHRPHRAGRRERRRHLVLRCRGTCHAARDRADDRHGDQHRWRFAANPATGGGPGSAGPRTASLPPPIAGVGQQRGREGFRPAA